MTAAIFGLVGVVIGVLVTAGTNFLLARRTERAEMRQSVRLVADEIDALIRGGLAAVSDYDRLPLRGLENNAAMLLPTHEWLANKTVLAKTVPDSVWDKLTDFYREIDASRMYWIDLGHEHPLDQEDLKDVRESIRQGHELIQAMGQTPTESIDDLMKSAGTKRDY